ncbi:MAG: RNA polymerase sigma factor [Deltaproteobacteria bacterium]|nr:RNA polymerase sigma factor [Deltaproteobacteria bacterium]
MAADDRNDPLEACMEAFLQGDARGFERLYRRLAPRLRGVLRGLCGDPRLADDLTQTTFLKVHQARETYRSGAPVEPWVFAIARRTWLDHLRYRRRRPEALSDDGQLPEAPSEGASPRGFESLSSDALEKLERSLGELSPPQREAIVLLKVDGLSVAEAAEVAGVSASNLKVRAHRGYEALRRALGVGRTP